MDGRSFWLVLIGALLCGLAGCMASPLGRTIRASALAEECDVIMVSGLQLPPVQGIEGCGAQALACAMHKVDPAKFPDPAQLAAELPWRSEGATPIDLLLEARRRGLAVSVHRGDRWRLENLIRRDQATLVMIDAGPVVQTPKGTIPTSRVMHWAVVSGMTRDRSRVFLAAEDGFHHEMPREEFMRRWRYSDNCLLAFQPTASSEPSAPNRR